MSPIVDGLAQDFSDRIVFQRLNAHQEGEKEFRQFGLRGHPAYVMLDRRGKVAWQMVGQMSRQDLEAAIRRALE